MPASVHRNDPCPCGSGKKYKKCCGFKELEKKKENVSLRRGSLFTPGSNFGAADLTKKLFKVLKKQEGTPEGQATKSSQEEPAITGQDLVDMTKGIIGAFTENNTKSP